jgi:hypothetical protein
MKTGRTLSLGLVAAGLVACSAADSGPRNVGTGGSPGTGGQYHQTGGGNPYGTGGSTYGTGGSSGTGGSNPGTGGGNPYGTGGGYGTDGSVPATCTPDSQASALITSTNGPGYGKSTTGSWGGYVFTYKYGTASISPFAATGAFDAQATSVCACGSVPADDKSGAGVGYTLSQPKATGSTSPTITPVAVTTPVHVKISGYQTGMRVNLTVSDTVQYCANLTSGDQTFALSDFKTECWGTTGTAYAGAAIQSIQIAVPGGAAAAKTFSICVLDIEPG